MNIDMVFGIFLQYVINGWLFEILIPYSNTYEWIYEFITGKGVEMKTLNFINDPIRIKHYLIPLNISEQIIKFINFIIIIHRILGGVGE